MAPAASYQALSNDKSAIVGSANFTRSGISTGNCGCLLYFTKDTKLYEDALKAARRHFDENKGFQNARGQPFSKRLESLDKLVTSLEELESYLTELYQEISSIA